MAKPTLDLIQNPQKLYKSKDHKRRAKGMSFLAFVFSVFFYISVFYIFNLSPSQNFKNSKFWFFISNTLILIIAADYGAFSSSSRERHDVLSEEYLARTSLAKNNSVGGFVPVLRHDPETVEENVSGEEKRVVWEETKAAAEVEPEREADSKQRQEEEEEEVAKNGPQDDEAEKQVEVNGEAEKEIVANEVPESQTENVIEGAITEENDEFSSMSDEELNRRVEEFIRKLKRQIQLQGV
ncbi:uncharacterized protein LOC104444845 [Eucalyptus grandis]|uniref:uncharacterized protein LOC104444845 n=1 Tax=Eucalyptus grandis TaxID=71139 RepID=UPI00192F0D31|nr:uncharacterized protein LOC104444845 [Eucalyptus grandis]